MALRRQPGAHGFDVRHGACAPAATAATANSSPTTLAASSTCRASGREGLDAPQEQLPQPHRQTRHLRRGPLAQRPLPRPPHHHLLLHQMLHDGDHEQRIAVRARRDQAREGGGHRPAQPSGHIRRHVRRGQELQPQLAPLAPAIQLLDHPTQGMRLEQHLHRPIRPQHQQPRRLGPLRQVGEGLDRRGITPLQVFQDQHQRPVGRQYLQRLGELAQHPGRCHAVQAAVEPLQLRLAHQAGQLRQPHRRIPSQDGTDHVPLGPLAQPPQRFHEG